MKTKQLPEKGRRGTNRRRPSNGTFVEKVDRQEKEEEKNSVFAPPTTTTNGKLISLSLSLTLQSPEKVLVRGCEKFLPALG